MKKYMIKINGELEDDVFDTEDEAKEQALYLMSCSREGAEILNLSNPGDYPLEDYVEPDYEIVEV